jgi:hypothetical protein
MIDKTQAHKVLIQENLEKAKSKKMEMKSKAEEQLKREPNMWSNCKIACDERL